MNNKNNPADLEAPFKGLIEGISDQEMTDAIQITAHGFTLDHSKLSQINRGLNDLYQLAPINSLINLDFTSVQDFYSATLNVSSNQQTFAHSANGTNLEALYFELEKSVLDQISLWKKNRFKK